MENPSVYIPIDRRLALAREESLPEHTFGAALFADISGFTPLTEVLARELGPKRGAEELTSHLNRVYDAIIADLHRYRGSVLSFSGDAITCWFDRDDGSRATASALAMQQTMEEFTEVSTSSGIAISLGIKIAVASGPVRRFLVGDPDYLIIDVMAGTTLENLAVADHMAGSGDVILDAATAASLGEGVGISSWKTDEVTNERFAVVKTMNLDVPDNPWPPLSAEVLSGDQTRAWLLPRIHERLQAGQGEFLAELRPAVSLFLSFSGIDYDGDEAAGEKLNTFIKQVEHVLLQYDGSLNQISIGDKGSYLYAAFGAPISHEDDAIRAAEAALQLHTTSHRLDFIEEVHIGIARGRMRSGAYGSQSRRTYGVLGDAVNLSARLMTAAAPGQTIVSGQVRDFTGDTFTWRNMPAIHVKGKTEPVAISHLVGLKMQTAACLRVPKYSLPMVGRTAELNLSEKKLDLALSSKGQVVSITGDAGMGKSRLAAEVIHLADQKGFMNFGGECQSYGTHTSYLPWHNIWRCFFGLAPVLSQERQIELLEQELTRINPFLIPRLPLLGVVTNLSIPDNDLTGSLNAKVRKSSLEGMLVECLREQARKQPMMLVLEDCHWLDPLSHDLIEVIGRSLVNLPVVMLLMYRPLELHHLQTPRVSKLPYFTNIALTEFTPQEADKLIQLKLAQFFGPSPEVSPTLLERVTTQAEGNPFYIEELLNFLRDKGIDPTDNQALEALDLPGSVYSLILSRMDQLTENQQITMKVASVIGRLFQAAMVWGVYSKLGGEEKVKGSLEILRRSDITILDTPEPELTYLFKHIVTQQVAYNSLVYSTRAMLHNAIGSYIERVYSKTLDQYINLLAFHYENSENIDKKRVYLLMAGETAQRDYANLAAIEYYEKVLPLLALDDQVDVLLKLGEVLKLIGEWDRAGDRYNQALSLTEQLGDKKARAWVETAMGEFIWKQGHLEESTEWLLRARTGFEEMDELAGVGQVLHYMGVIADQQGDYEMAHNLMQESLTIRQKTGDQRQAAYLLGNMGIVARRQGNLEDARSLYEESLALRRELGDRWGIANVLNNLGNVTLDLEDHSKARSHLEEAVSIHRELGDRWAIGNALNNLANVYRTQGDYAAAKKMYDESLVIYGDLGDKWALAYLFEDVAWLEALQGNAQRAMCLVAAGSVLREQINAPLSPAETDKLMRVINPIRETLSVDEQSAATTMGREMAIEQAIDCALAASIS